MAKLTEKTFATAVTLNSLIHIVNTGDTTQSAYGSSYKASLNQLVPLFGSNPDVTVTGGTYNPSTGIVTFFNNTGGTFNVSGFVTGFTDSYVSGGTYTAGTATFTNTTGGTFTVTGFTTGDTSIYTTDGSLTNNRILTLNGRTLTFNGDLLKGDVIINPTGQVTLLAGASDGGILNLDSLGVSFQRAISIKSNGVLRWLIQNTGVELGSNTGTNLEFERYDDAGTLLGSALKINRTNGNVGINNTTPSEKLDVSGKTKTTTLQITSGATNGYVLTSDASGNATWQASSGGVTIDPYNNVGNTGTTLTWDVSGNSTNYQATLTANTTLNLTNVRNGDYGTLIVTQDIVGSRTITFGTVNGAGTTHRVTNGGFGSPTLTSNANAIDILTFTYNGSTMFWTVGNDYT